MGVAEGLEHLREVRHVAGRDEEILALLRVLLASVDPTQPGLADLEASLLRQHCMVHDETEIERLSAILTSAEKHQRKRLKARVKFLGFQTDLLS